MARRHKPGQLRPTRKRRGVNSGTCRIYGCNKPILVKKAELCCACYHAERYWSFKTPSQRAERKRKLVLFHERMICFEETIHS